MDLAQKGDDLIEELAPAISVCGGCRWYIECTNNWALYQLANVHKVYGNKEFDDTGSGFELE